MLRITHCAHLVSGYDTVGTHRCGSCTIPLLQTVADGSVAIQVFSVLRLLLIAPLSDYSRVDVLTGRDNRALSGF